MNLLAAAASIGLILIVLWDAFEVIILPRRVTRKFRLTRFFYRSTWKPWRALGRQMAAGNRRELFLSFYGPVSLILLLGIWACGLILGFAFLHSSIRTMMKLPDGEATFFSYLYFSGSTFFTLGLGDVVPQTRLGRGLTIVEAGMGLGFLAIVIGYLPVLYQAFSRRELNISLLDARAGSPLPATELDRVRRNLASRGISLHDGAAAAEKLNVLRRMYEPYVNALSEHLLMPLPAWEVESAAADNWQTSAWERVAKVTTDHF